MWSRPKRRTLAVSIITRDSADRLPRLLREAATFADEILVGVDQGSSDDTFEVARSMSSVVYRYRHDGEISPARMLAFEHTGCDWMLVLDDDEGVDTALPQLLPELIGDDRYTNWQLPRKWVVNLAPFEYAKAPPWYPDYQLRLFRADKRIVWKPVGIHTGMRVMGPAGWADGGAILHYEPILLAHEGREAKLEAYRSRGSQGRFEELYANSGSCPRGTIDPPPLQPGRSPSRRGTARIDPRVVDLDERPRLPPWNAEIKVQMQDEALPGEQLVVAAEARNTGELMWVPQTATQAWPILNLSYRVRDARGTLVDPPGERTCVPRYVAPGETARFLCRALAPDEPGDYVLEWEMLSEYECWFTDCGAEPAHAPLRVTEPRANAAERGRLARALRRLAAAGSPRMTARSRARNAPRAPGNE